MISTILGTISRRLRRPWASDLTPEARQTRADKALAQRFRALFEKDLQEAEVSGLHFYVREGTVILYGAVRHELDRDLVVDLAQQVLGVEDVKAHLQIADEQGQDEQGQDEQGQDEQIAKRQMAKKPAGS